MFTGLSVVIFVQQSTLLFLTGLLNLEFILQHRRHTSSRIRALSVLAIMIQRWHCGPKQILRLSFKSYNL